MKTDNIEQLIVSFPPFTTEEDISEEEEDNLFLEKVIKIWRDLEEFVGTSKVTNLGVADFNVNQLKKLFDAATIKPCVNHFNIDSCCVVSFV